MLENLGDLATRENLIRYRFRLEVAGAVLYAVIAFVEQGIWGSGLVGALAVPVLAGTIVLHRIRPAIALGVIAILPMLLVVSGFASSAPSVTLWVPVLLGLFAAPAYGGEVARWAALPIAILGGIFVSFSSFREIGGTGPAFLLYFAATLCLFLLPWIGGTLVRVNRQRRAAQTTATVATAERDQLEVSVALEQERNRVARDVHDIVAHSLAVVIAQADGARYAVKKNPEAVDEALEAIAATARDSLADVRVLLTELRHSQEAGPQPGMDDIDGLVRGFRESGLDLRWSSYGTATPLSEATGLAVYRILQESLTNALRHGDLTQPVDLEFDWSETALALSVTNGVADADRGGNPSGHGIPGMRERASLAGGSFSSGDGNNGRFRVRATLPVDRGTARTQPMARAVAP
ncbi:sensor histidine kinase [Naasia aerilata]|uniref:histidine kinase n=1 Tax=Naasia aerilata TaxID=1162966 RepID=A0ABN6XNS3_9MICO|nr:histidine kinase [Naasia aerilata]BDZ46647.1 two-component sensor histidine kinase [Naasia aerilata]